VIFDANAFLGKWPYWPVRASSPQEVATELDGWGIQRAAVCSTRSIFVNCEDGNREAESASRHDPERFVAFACLGTPEVSQERPCSKYDFDGYAARGFRGIRLYPQHHSYHPLYEDFVDEILEDAAARGWPVLLPLRLIMNWGMPVLDLAVMDSLITRHSRVNWILAGINYLHELQLAVALMRRFESVHLETSCVMGYAAISKLVERCGSERLLFGSGSPVQHGAAALSKILHAPVSAAAREQILAGNLLRLLGPTAPNLRREVR
jgi:predicted TIM-barrel fold metal-dependent hydrolase